MYSLFPCPCRGLSDHWNLPDNRGADSVNLEKVRENLRLVGFKLALAAKQFGHCGNVDFEGCGNILVGKPQLFFSLFDKIHVHRSEEHTSELQSLMRTSYDVFCLQQNTPTKYQSSIP